jgi:hypothetical protein
VAAAPGDRIIETETEYRLAIVPCSYNPHAYHGSNLFVSRCASLKCLASSPLWYAPVHSLVLKSFLPQRVSCVCCDWRGCSGWLVVGNVDPAICASHGTLAGALLMLKRAESCNSRSRVFFMVCFGWCRLNAPCSCTCSATTAWSRCLSCRLSASLCRQFWLMVRLFALSVRVCFNPVRTH